MLAIGAPLRIVGLCLLCAALFAVADGAVVHAQAPPGFEKGADAPKPWQPFPEYAPIAWSPTEDALCWVVKGSELVSANESESLLGVGSGVRLDEPTIPRSELWLASLSNGSTRLLGVLAGWYSAPTFSADGRNVYVAESEIAFSPDNGRSTGAKGPDVDGTWRSVRIHLDTGRREVLESRNGRFRRSQLERLPLRRCDCSPNGLWLAAPLLSPERLAIFALEPFRLVMERDNMDWTRWSPDSRRIVGFLGGDTPGIVELKGADWNTTTFVYPTPRLAQPITWERGGVGWFAGLFVQQPKASGSFEPSRLDVLRFSAADAPPRTIHSAPLVADGELKPGVGYFAVDDIDDTLVVSIAREGPSSRFEAIGIEDPSANSSWRTMEHQELLHGLAIGAPAFSHDVRWLAFRFGVSEPAAPVAVLRQDSRRLSMLLVQDAQAFKAFGILQESLRKLLRRPRTNSSPFRLGRPPSPPTDSAPTSPREPLGLFDPPKELAKRETETRSAIDRICQEGLEALRRTAGRSRTLVAQRYFDEQRLLFLYQRQAFPEALAAIEELDRSLNAADGVRYRRALEILRAQCMIGAGQLHQARRELARLRRPSQAGPRPTAIDHEARLLGVDSVGEASTAPLDPLEERLNMLEASLSADTGPALPNVRHRIFSE